MGILSRFTEIPLLQNMIDAFNSLDNTLLNEPSNTVLLTQKYRELGSCIREIDTIVKSNITARD